MSTQHTPGPWLIGTTPPNGEQTVGTHQGLMVAVATTGANIATEANARLIAAAPDLLDALQDAYEILGISYPLTEPDSDKRGVVLSKARAALLKAKGESND
jgi:hypothetical protein